MSKIDPWISPCDDPSYRPYDDDEWTQEDWRKFNDAKGEYLYDCLEEEE